MTRFKTTDRGFKYYEPIETDYGHEIRVYESSAARRPCIWLSVKLTEEKSRGSGIAPCEANAHMTIEQAEMVRDVIDAAIKNHYQLSEQWHLGEITGLEYLRELPFYRAVCVKAAQEEGEGTMTSSPEQEIPQEIVEKAARVLDVRTNGEEKVARRDVYDHWRDYARLALVAVLPDLQRPLLEEIERERETRKALAQITDRRKTERDDYLKELGEINVERQCQEVRAVEAERERDARPDLTDDEKQVVIEALDPTQWKPPYDGVTRSARAKLERSLDV